MARQVGEKRNRRNCTRGAFCVISTTGSIKLRKKSANFYYKLSDSGSRYWEDLLTPDYGVNTLLDGNNEEVYLSTQHMAEHEDDNKFFQTATGWILPSTERFDDIDMGQTDDLQRRESLPTSLIINMPQRASRCSPKDLGVLAEELGMVLDHPLLMDIEPSDSSRIVQSPVVVPLSKPLLPEPSIDIIMHDEANIRKSKEIQLLERVRETLRQKKFSVPQV